MGRFPGETSCLSLVWAVLDLFFSHASNGATFTDLDRQHLYRIKYQPTDPTSATVARGYPFHCPGGSISSDRWSGAKAVRLAEPRGCPGGRAARVVRWAGRAWAAG